MPDTPLAYFLTWTCYGTWLPGDERGWTKWHRGDNIPQPLLADWCARKLVERPLILNDVQRKIVEETITQHCDLRGWQLHATNCRSNHCHVVVTATNNEGEQVRDQLKSWTTRKLKAQLTATKHRDHWWTGKGSVRYLFDEESVEAAIVYTYDAPDAGGSKSNQ